MERRYVLGFLASVLLTLATYFAVMHKLLPTEHLLTLIAIFAVVQASVQLFIFLHIGEEKKPHWKLTIFLFMLLVLVIIVFGSIWIMYSLNYNLMNPQEMHAY
jgi:cytochrome o ubiquinol oxidase subunit IV